MPSDARTIRFDPITHRYWTGVRELVSVTTVLRDAGLVDPTWYTEASRARGTALHRATAALDRGAPLAIVDLALEPYVAAYAAFRHDARPVWHGIDDSVADVRLGYAGTRDRWGTLHGDAAVVDLTTGPVPPWAPLQLVGYARLDLDDHRGLRRRRLVVQLLLTGRYTVREYPLVNFGRDERVFLAALAVAQWKRAASGHA